MNFTSPFFYLCLAAAGIAFYWIPGRFRPIYLLALSYAFYALSSTLYLALLLVATATVYAVGLGIANGGSERTKSRLMLVGVAAMVAVIVAFKAAGAATGFLLPLGLSYYSFKLISYLIEVYWDEDSVERDPVIFFLYPAFFPQIVSGPIQRPETFFLQMREVMGRAASDPQVETGFRFILGGLMLKLLVGDRLGGFIDRVDAAHSEFTYDRHARDRGLLLCFNSMRISPAIRTSPSASGNSLASKGPPNFNAPFAASNIQEFWRRWHMSLTSWVTDYLFTPLSMSLRTLGQIASFIGITLNMLIIGLWHGFTPNFVVFGLLQAVFIILTVLASRWFSVEADAKARAPGAFNRLSGGAVAFGGIILTFVAMSFSSVFWRAPTMSQALSILAQVVGLTEGGSLGISSLGAGAVQTVWICAAISLYDGLGAPGAASVAARLDTFAPKWIQYGVCVFALITLAGEGGGHFVYGQF